MTKYLPLILVLLALACTNSQPAANTNSDEKTQNAKIDANTTRITALEKTDAGYLVKFNKLDTAVPALRARLADQLSVNDALNKRVFLVEQRNRQDSQTIVFLQTLNGDLQKQVDDLQDIGVQEILENDKRDHRIDSLKALIVEQGVRVDTTQFTVNNKVISITRLNAILNRLALLEAKVK